MKCPICSDEMDEGSINFNDTRKRGYPVLNFWWCRSPACGYWTPCSVKGVGFDPSTGALSNYGNMLKVTMTMEEDE